MEGTESQEEIERAKIEGCRRGESCEAHNATPERSLDEDRNEED